MSQPQQFVLTLEETGRQLSALLDVLDAEHVAVLGTDPQRLAEIVRHKLALLAELEKLSIARDKLQIELGFQGGLDEAGRLVLQKLPHLEDTWQVFLALCKQVARKNTANGMLVTQNSQRAKQVLALLTGRDDRSDVYNRSGENSARLSRCSFGRV